MPVLLNSKFVEDLLFPTDFSDHIGKLRELFYHPCLTNVKTHLHDFSLVEAHTGFKIYLSIFNNPNITSMETGLYSLQDINPVSNASG